MKRTRRPGKRLQAHVADLVSKIEALCPNARLNVSYQRIESEDATIYVYVPSDWTFDQSYELSDSLAGLRLDLLLATGYSILTLVKDPPERVQQENEAFRAARL